MNQEYESVLLAALLHDIGKFYQRGLDKHVHKHSIVSESFVEQFRNIFPNADLVKLLVGHHHEGSSAPTNKLPNDIGDEKQRMLAYIVSRADNFSSGERSEGDIEYKPLTPLDSVLSQVQINQGSEQKSAGKYTQLEKLYSSATALIPSKDSSDFLHNQETYDRYNNEFSNELAELFSKPYEGMVDTLTSLIQKYLWCIPSDTSRKPCDISLADHIKTSCAIAACLYQYHVETGWDEKSVMDDSLPKCLFIAGDISGIQKYIYEIASVGKGGGVAKRLRGRSFKISLLTEMIAMKILRTFNLPQACKLMSAGGQFYLLIPNTDAVKQRLQDLMIKTTRWMLKEYVGELAISYAYKEMNKEMFTLKNFGNTLTEVKDKLEVNKLRKFEDIYLNSDEECGYLFDLEFQGRPACPICDRQPSVYSDEYENNAGPCGKCENDARVGQLLTKDNKWLVINQTANKDSISYFGDEPWHVHIKDKLMPDDRPLFVYNLRDGELLKNVAGSFFMHAGYVPRWNYEEWQNAKDKTPNIIEQDDYDDYMIKSGAAIKSFSALAHQSNGHKLLGVLRADVDNLGLIFSKGLGDRATISRISTMSNQLNYFFTVILTNLLENKYPNVYTVYAGGDDLMLIGPWSDLIELSKTLNEQFNAYVSNNPSITFSAGIGTFNRKAPIATTSVQTGEILEASKENKNKNSLTLFGATFNWSEYNKVKEWKDLLEHSISSEEGGISSSFLYKLFVYQQQAKRYYAGIDGKKEGDKERNIMYRPRLAYDIGRNYTTNDGKPKIDENLYQNLLMLIEPESRRTWELLQAPITWTSYTIRKEK